MLVTVGGFRKDSGAGVDVAAPGTASCGSVSCTDGISNAQDVGVRVAEIDALAYLYAETTDATYVG